jgi:hypothetical protein
MFDMSLASLYLAKGKRRDIVREKERPQLKPMLLRACCYQVSQRLSAEIEGRAKFFNEKKIQFPTRTTISLDDSKIIQLSSIGKSTCKEICSQSLMKPQFH